jgi:hypothetical protein
MASLLASALSCCLLCCLLCCAATAPAHAQKKTPKAAKAAKPATTPAVKSVAAPATPPRTACTEAECKAHLQFLASDRLLGRGTGSAGCDTAAAYIARHFQSLGLQPPSGMNTYFQPVAFVRSRAPQSTTIGLKLPKAGTLNVSAANIYVTHSRPVNMSVEAVYVGFGVVDSARNRDDYAAAGSTGGAIDVRGKLVITRFGLSDSSTMQQGSAWVRRKRDAALKRGAIGVVELLGGQAAFAWGMFGQFFNRPRMTEREAFQRDTTGLLGVYLVNDGDKSVLSAVQQQRTCTLNINSSGTVIESAPSQNVLAVLPGTDPQLRNEFLLLSAHYDHLGTANRPGMQDTIYNGARDNGMGTTAVLGAASILALKPLKRSVLFAAWTAEEMGLLGSDYYAEHPAIPHKNIVFNLNTDGAGFNDTMLITVIGLARTSAEAMIKQGAESQGLRAVSDPAPEQNLFDRSDNVHFAVKGIPAPTLAPGFSAFDAAIGKYYHQVGDEAGDDFNFRYLTRYVNAFIDTARRIGDASERPRWMAGDKYEPAFQSLYGTK